MFSTNASAKRMLNVQFTDNERLQHRRKTDNKLTKNGRRIREKRMNTRRTDDKCKQHEHVHRRFRSALKERRSLRSHPWIPTALQCKYHGELQNETEWKRNGTECKRNKTETVSNAETAKQCWTQMEREFHSSIHGFNLLQLVEICREATCMHFGSCFVRSWHVFCSDGWQKATPFNCWTIVNKTIVIINH